MDEKILIEHKNPEPRRRDYRTPEDFARAIAEWKPRTVKHPARAGVATISRKNVPDAK